jgi:glycine/D-amino acid oxidase-like deaminating enzyme
MLESERIWKEFQAARDVGHATTGITYLCRTEGELAARQRWLDGVSEFHLDTRIVGPGELKKVLHGIEGTWAGALSTASDGRAEPHRAVAAFASAAVEAGAHIRTACAVRGIETSAGRISGAVTEHGTIACNSVVLAGGAWSGLFCDSLDLRLPQLKVIASVMRIDAFEGGPAGAAWGPGFAFRKRDDGGYTVANGSANIAEIVPNSFRYFLDFLPVLRFEWHDLRLRFGTAFFDEAWRPRKWTLDAPSPFEAVRVLDPRPHQDALQSALSHLTAAFPAFAGRSISNHWAGAIDATPDALPVVSAVDSIPGLFITTGYSGHGFGIGPGAGKLMASIVTGDTPIVDPLAFRYSRFTDGSRPRPTTGL